MCHSVDSSLNINGQALKKAYHKGGIKTTNSNYPVEEWCLCPSPRFGTRALQTATDYIEMGTIIKLHFHMHFMAPLKHSVVGASLHNQIGKRSDKDSRNWERDRFVRWR